MSAPTPSEAQALLRVLTRTLCAVAVLALVFTAVNITLFAHSRGIPLGIAVLLDPMLSLALAAVLLADSRLASWGLRPPRWSATLRWFTGGAATLMNTWESIWPTGQIGWPINADPAAVLLHAAPTVLLILLTETIAAYRRVVSDILRRTDEADPPPAPSSPTAAHCTAGTDRPDQIDVDTAPSMRRDSHTPREPRTPAPTVHPTPTGVASSAGIPAVAPRTPPAGSVGPPPDDSPADGDLWLRALAVDADARAAGRGPASRWRLRSELHIGPSRARRIHNQLTAHHQSALTIGPDPSIGTARSDS
ncbi:extensin [Streptomyces sp. TRM66268-LWL]|uniref:Extensin n=1 Tax=Streptomyces polyasparticus TaxID=2767826 RepID=A0ABR7STV5_9ACTN|nr:extensin [Streptomyces polyasparticus]MBC9718032.1 extensin [Streptomyces polyasparticus]